MYELNFGMEKNNLKHTQGEIIYLLVFKEILKISQRFLSYLSCKVKCLKSLKVGGVI